MKITDKRFSYLEQSYLRSVKRMWYDSTEEIRYFPYEEPSQKPKKLDYRDQKSLILYDPVFIYDIANPNWRIIKLASHALIKYLDIFKYYEIELEIDESCWANWGVMSNAPERFVYTNPSMSVCDINKKIMQYKCLIAKKFLETFKNCKCISKELRIIEEIYDKIAPALLLEELKEFEVKL